MLRSEKDIENFLAKAKKQVALGDDDYQFVVDTLKWVLGFSGGQTAQLLNEPTQILKEPTMLPIPLDEDDDMPREVPKPTFRFPSKKTFVQDTEPAIVAE